MDWIALIAAGIFEMLGITMINEVVKKQSDCSFFRLASVSYYSLMRWKQFRWGQRMRFGQALGHQVAHLSACFFITREKIGSESCASL